MSAIRQAGSVENGAAAAGNIPAIFAWLVAGVPMFVVGVGVLLDGLFDPSTDSGLELLGTIIWVAYFGLNVFFIHKDEKLLEEFGRRDGVLTFMRIGMFVPPVYLIARAAKSDKKWIYAIIGTVVWLSWMWWTFTD